MTVFEVLTEMIGTEELLRLIALAELVYVGQVCSTSLPIRRRIVWKLFATISANIKSCELSRWRRWLLEVVIGWWNSGQRVECAVILTIEGGARPRMLA